MPDPITVRQGVAEDAEAIAMVQVDSWRAAYRGTVPDLFLDRMSVAERGERWLQAFADPSDRRLTRVAECDDCVVGFVALGPCRDEDASPRVGELHAIYVAPERWRQGIGAALHETCLAELRLMGYNEARLWVLAANPAARAFYERLGWAFDGTAVEHAFGDTRLPLVRYRRPL
jgi:RimJ/RimL family protein N-acetyltransferase